ncbi:MAG: hypothetical protein ACJ76Z_13620 [Thermoleophilaceae bacterium]
MTAAPALPDPATFLSGEHGHVGGRRRLALRRAGDRALDAWLAATGAPRRLDALAARTPVRDVAVACVGSSQSGLLEAALAELRASGHRVELAIGDAGGRGKFENLNTLLADRPAPGWLLVVDDDVSLPPRFLDRFVALCERCRLDLAQPAQTLASHAAWRFARRRPFSVLRETNFVEIGPVTAFGLRAAAELLPFPELRFGWGLDAHWSALAAARGWRLGIADALPVRHEQRPVAAGYATTAATEEAREFLAGRPYVPAAEAGTTLRVHRRVPSA